MIRLSRAGREQAILNAIRKLNSDRGNVGYYMGEITKVMGVTSQSKIRYILRDMVERGYLWSGTSAIDGYPDELEVYQIAKYEQPRLIYIDESPDERNDRLWELIIGGSHVAI